MKEEKIGNSRILMPAIPDFEEWMKRQQKYLSAGDVLLMVTLALHAQPVKLADKSLTEWNADALELYCYLARHMSLSAPEQIGGWVKRSALEAQANAYLTRAKLFTKEVKMTEKAIIVYEYIKMQGYW